MTRDEALDLMRQYSESVDRLPGLDSRQWGVAFSALHMPMRFPAGGSEAKAMRWLGYLQGVLVALGVYSLEDVKRHSMNRRVD